MFLFAVSHLWQIDHGRSFMKVVKVDFAEIVMLSELIKTALDSQSLPRIHLQQLVDHITRITVHILRPLYVPRKDFVKGGYFRRPLKWHSPRMHAVNNAAERPQVRSRDSQTLLQHLRWHVKRCAAESSPWVRARLLLLEILLNDLLRMLLFMHVFVGPLSTLLLILEILRIPQINDPDMLIIANHYVLGF